MQHISPRLLFLPLCLGLALEPYSASTSPSPVSPSSASSSPSPVSASPYSFTLDSTTHQLHTTWELRGTSVSQFCAFGDFSLVELGFTGKEQVELVMHCTSSL